jgi:succinate dehydrogenase/fumarate reductase flavoprotein subunit
LRAEGTVRGVGGLRVVDEDCQTRVRGLFAAGDAATREPVAGATSGGGAQNSAWALSSGQWSGRAAAQLAKRDGRRTGTSAAAIGEAGLRQAADGPTAAAAVAAVKEEMHPLDKNLFRTGYGLIRSLEKLDGLWRGLRDGLPDGANNRLRAREAAAMAATGRWCYRAALARGESRGMHKRLDAKLTEERFEHRLRVGGLDQVWTRAEPVSAPKLESLA